jgi:hypothetical protein
MKSVRHFLLSLVEKINIIDAYIKIGTKLCHLTRKRKNKKFKTSHKKNEKKNEFESLRVGC